MHCDTVATNADSAAAFVFPASKSSRPLRDNSVDDDPNDFLCLVNFEEPFCYVIRTFDVELLHCKIKGFNQEGKEELYDVFARNDPSFQNHVPGCWRWQTPPLLRYHIICNSKFCQWASIDLSLSTKISDFPTERSDRFLLLMYTFMVNTC